MIGARGSACRDVAVAFASGRPRRGRAAGAFILAWAIGVAVPPARAQNEVAAPSWLRAPSTRGPVAATLSLDDRRSLWGVNGALPLDFGLRGPRAASAAQAALGLGLSITGASDTRDLRYSALLDRCGGRTGEWLGFSTGNTPSRLHLGIGFWRSLARVGVEAGIVSSVVGVTERQENHWGFFRDSLHWRDTTTYSAVSRTAQRTTAQGALHWNYRRLELTAISGVVVGLRAVPQSWAQANAQLQLSKRVLLLAAVGQRPDASLAFDASARPGTMLSVQVQPWASRDPAASGSTVPRATSWITKRLEDGRTVLCVRCRRASQVELAGDFTEWVSVPLTALGGDWWETTLAIPSGLHQVQIRMDGGAWQAPPRLPTMEREFAGVTGVLLTE